MKSLITPFASLALLMASSVPQDAAAMSSCSVHMAHHVRVDANSVQFLPGKGSQHSYSLSNGQLTINGQRIALQRDDVELLRLYEQEVRELFVEAKGLAVDAIDLAEDVLAQVLPLTALNPDSAPITLPPRARATLDQLRQDVLNATGSDDIDEARVRELAQTLVRDLMPMLVGRVSALALKAALTGNDALIADIEARAARLEDTLETLTRDRAEAIEARAEALCPRVNALRDIETNLAWQPESGPAFRVLSKR